MGGGTAIGGGGPGGGGGAGGPAIGAGAEAEGGAITCKDRLLAEMRALGRDKIKASLMVGLADLYIYIFFCFTPGKVV